MSKIQTSDTIDDDFKNLKRIKTEEEKEMLPSSDDSDRIYDFYFTEISQIQINIQSNIPNKQHWVLKRSNFMTKFERPPEAEKITEYSDLPFFTNEVEYPVKQLYQLQPYQIFDFFFNRDYFETTLNNILFIKKKAKLPISTGDEKRIAENNSKNILVMLQLLFTTVYSRTNNITTSINEYIQKGTNPLNLNRLINNNDYTYINEDKTEYTVMKICWLNDVLNHPLYKNLFEEFYKYKYWCQRTSKKLDVDIDNNFVKIEQSILSFTNFDELLTTIQNRLQSVDSSSDQRTRAITFEQELFETYLNSFNKIIKSIDSYKKLKKNEITDSDFYNEITKNKADFEPKLGQLVEISLDRFLPTINITVDQTPTVFTMSDKKGVDVGKGYWYIGKITKINRSNYSVRIDYLQDTKTNNEKSIEITLEKKYIREPLLKNILNIELSDSDKTNIEIELINKGINFPKKDNLIDNDIFAKRINNLDLNKIQNLKFVNIFKRFTLSDLPLEIKKELINNGEVLKYARYRIRDTSTEDRIKQLIYLKTQKTPKDTLFDYLDIFGENYNRVKSNLIISGPSKGFIERILNLYKTIVPIRVLNETYFKTYKMDIQNTNALSAYKEYNDLVKKFKQFLQPTRETSNKPLQDILNSYSENINSDRFISILEELETCYLVRFQTPKCPIIKSSKSLDIALKYINTDVNYVNFNNLELPQYEIYLHIDFVKGHLDKTNLGTIKCAYNDEMLTKRFEKMTKMKSASGDWMLIHGPFLSVSPAKLKPSTISRVKDYLQKSNIARFLPKALVQTKPSIPPVAQPVPPSVAKEKKLTKKKGGKTKRKTIKYFFR